MFMFNRCSFVGGFGVVFLYFLRTLLGCSWLPWVARWRGLRLNGQENEVGGGVKFLFEDG